MKMIDWTKDPFWEPFQQWKREVLSPYCLNGCQTSCCDLTDKKIVLDKKGLVALLGFKPDDLTPFETDKEGRYTYDEGFCPRYDLASRSCRIPDHPGRPSACEKYPIFDMDLKRIPSEDRWVAINPLCDFSQSEQLESLQELGRQYEVDVFVFEKKKKDD